VEAQVRDVVGKAEPRRRSPLEGRPAALEGSEECARPVREAPHSRPGVGDRVEEVAQRKGLPLCRLPVDDPELPRLPDQHVRGRQVVVRGHELHPPSGGGSAAALERREVVLRKAEGSRRRQHLVLEVLAGERNLVRRRLVPALEPGGKPLDNVLAAPRRGRHDGGREPAADAGLDEERPTPELALLDYDRKVRAGGASRGSQLGERLALSELAPSRETGADLGQQARAAPIDEECGPPAGDDGCSRAPSTEPRPERPRPGTPGDRRGREEPEDACRSASRQPRVRRRRARAEDPAERIALCGDQQACDVEHGRAEVQARGARD
jgi:hypothetical protein